MFAQEVKVKRGEIDSFVEWAAEHGWKAMVAPCAVLDSKRRSGGVAIFARNWCGLGPVATGETVVCEARAMVCQCSIPGLAQFAAASVYLHDGEGASQRNISILEKIGCRVAELNLPFVIGADFNMDPNLLDCTMFADKLRATICAYDGSLGTYTHPNGVSNIDYFVASSAMAAVVHSVGLASDLPMPKDHGHRGVRLKLQANAASLTKVVVVPVQKLPSEPVFGPRRPPLDWTTAMDAAEHACHVARTATRTREVRAALSNAYKVWAEIAEQHLADLAGVELHAKRLPRAVGYRVTHKPLLGNAPRAPAAVSVVKQWAHRWGHEMHTHLRLGRLRQFNDLHGSVGQEAPQWIIDAGGQQVFSEVCGAASAALAAHARSHDEFSEALEDLEQYVDAIGAAAAAEDDDDNQRRAEEWKTWAAAAFEGSCKAAHHWSKGPYAWTPQSVIAQGCHSIAPRDIFLSHSDRCKDLWVHMDERIDQENGLLPPSQRQALPRLTAAEIQAAALASSSHTCCSYDGFHPRHLGHMDEEGRDVVAAMWEACEYASIVPPQIRHVMAPLIPKRTGGFRDLGLFAGLIRVCAKARRKYSREWEDRNERPYFASGKGTGAPDVVWRSAFHCETAVASNSTAAAILWDMKSFYQMIRHDLLMDRAVATRYPLPLVRMLIALYKAPRHVTILGETAPAVKPTRGVVPGCTHAQTLVKVYCLQPFDSFCVRHPSTPLDVFVDDLQVAGYGDEERVIQETVAAALDLRTVVSNEIKAALASTKSAVVASKTRVARRIRALLGADGGEPVVVAQALGIDFAAGRSGVSTAGRSSRAKRIYTASGKAQRISRLAKAGRRQPQHVVRQGIIKGALYGANVTGISDGNLLKLRRICASTTPPRAQGRSLDLALHFAGCDPGPEATLAPIVRWAQEIWNSSAKLSSRSVPIAELVAGWNRAQPHLVQNWRRVNGPMSAAAMSAKRLKWTVGHPFIWHNDLNETVHLGRCSPAMVDILGKQSFQRLLEQRVASSTKDPALRGARAFLDPVRKLLSSSALCGMTARGRGALCAACCNAIWTNQRLHDAGYAVGSLCESCSSGAVDTVFHRVWECTSQHATAAREQHASRKLVARAKAAGPSSALFTRALAGHPAASVPKPAGDDSTCVVFCRAGMRMYDPASWTLSGNIFYDGACTSHVVPELSRAGWGAVEVDEQGNVLASVQGPVCSPLPQTAQAGEHCGRTAVVELLDGPSVLYGDCRSVCDAAKWSFARALNPKLVHSAASRMARFSPGNRFVTEDCKVKAHMDPDKVLDPQLKWRALGNKAADERAVAAKYLHPTVTDREWKAVADAISLQQHVARVIGEVLASFPSAPRVERAVGPRARASSATAKVDSHEWVGRAGLAICCRCFAFRDPQGQGAQSVSSACKPAKAEARQLIGSPHGHRLIAAKCRGSTIVACLRCGRWAGKRFRALSSPCAGRCMAGGSRAVRRIRCMLHPKESATLEQAFPLWLASSIIA